MESRICRLCFSSIMGSSFVLLEGVYAEMLKTVFLDFDLSAISSTVICDRCSEGLQKTFEFKMACLKDEEYVKSFVNWNNFNKVRLHEVLQNALEKQIEECQKICRLCFDTESIFYKELKLFEDGKLGIMLAKCLPEMDLELTYDPLICKRCLDHINFGYTFIESCGKPEQNVKNDLNLFGTLAGSTDIFNGLQYSLKNKFERADCDQLNCENEAPCGDLDTKENAVYLGVNVQYVIKPDVQNFDDVQRSPSVTTNYDNSSINVSELTPEVLPALVQFTEPVSDLIERASFECEEFNLDYKSQNSMRTYQCKACEYTSCDEIEFKYHYLIHKANARIYTCEHCSFVTRHANVRDNHRLVHLSADEVVWYNCKFCTFRTKLRGNLEKHELTHTMTDDKKRFKCEDCPYRTNWKRDLERHVIKHKNPKEIEMHRCTLCAFSTRHQRYLKFHIQKMHVGEEDSDKIYSCAQCSFSTRLKRGLIPHMDMHRDPGNLLRYHCSYCDYSAIRKESVRKHEVKHTKKFKCEHCDFQTNLKRYLKEHLLGHKPVESPTVYNCEKCSFKTVYKHSIVSHRMVHCNPDELKMFKCSYCEHQAKRRCDLKQHIRMIHSETGAIFSCEQCVYKTRYKHNLRNHMKIMHDFFKNLTVFKCDICSFQTKYKSSIQSHRISFHTEIDESNLLECQECGFKTKTAELLKKHSILHKNPSEIQMFKCSSCSYESRHKRALQKHIEGHTQKPEGRLCFKCNQCGFMGKTRYAVKRHSKRHDREVKVEVELSFEQIDIKCEKIV